MSKNYLFTSESVTEGHPDKISDQVSDAVLDACLEQDPKSRVACETLVTTGLALIAGEITTKAILDYQSIVRKTIDEIGYNNSAYGFDAHTCSVQVALDQQSPDISQGVSIGEGLDQEMGAGDQGLMFGYASNETEELMPAPIIYAHKLTKKLSEVRKSKKLDFLLPDGKSQVTFRYENDQPVAIDTIVISTQHLEKATHSDVKDGVIEEVIKPIIPEKWLSKETKYLINPTGRFVIGGPMGDCGLTGRKIIVDTYGGMGRHGGGAFSGKDPSKVDRSACYMARYVAKHIVASGLARKCEVQVAYAIGYSHPVSLMVDSFGTGSVSDEEITSAVSRTFSFRPADILSSLDLLKPRYKPSAAYGHFGRSGDSFTWEKLDKVDQLKDAIKKAS